MREFDDILNKGEKVLWAGKPVAKPYIFEMPMITVSIMLHQL